MAKKFRIMPNANAYAKEHFTGTGGDISLTHLRRIAAGSYRIGFQAAQARLTDLLKDSDAFKAVKTFLAERES